MENLVITAINNISKITPIDTLNIINIKSSTGIINYLKNNSTPALYVLDINLKKPNQSFNLASIIKTYDPISSIIITSNTFDADSLSFLYKIEAMDYILKSSSSNMLKQIELCIIKSFKKFNNCTKNTIISIKSDYEDINISLEDVLYFETAQRSKKLIAFGKFAICILN